MTSLPTTLLLAAVLLPAASQESPAAGGIEVVEKTIGAGGMTVAIANVPIGHDPGQNGRDLLIHARRAKQLGANLLLTPEFGLSGGFCDDCWGHIAESDARDDAILAELKGLLDDRFRYILVNGPRRAGGDDEPRFLNSTYLICEDFDPDDPLGNEDLIYDKTFPPAGREQRYTRSGRRDALTFDTPWGRLGVLTCWDLGFPSMAQELAMRHRVDAILVLAAWRGGTERSYGDVTRDQYWGYQWEVMNACRAMENQVWMLSCNATGTQGDAEFFGHSGAWAPSGVPLAVAEGPSLLVLRGLDLPGEVAREKATFNHTSEFFGVYRQIPEAGTFSRHPEGP